MANYQYILTERDGNVGIVTLNRPKELNALNFQLVGELADALTEFDRDSEIRCMVITGAGEKAFAAGADIKQMSDKSPIEMMMGGFEAWQRIKQIRKPLIAAVGGYALGGGCELAMNCDMIVASENARFGQPEILLGVIPGAGGTQRLTRTIGKYLAMEVVPKGEHLTAAVKLAKEVAERAPIAAQLAKEAVLAAFETPLEEGLALERKNFFLLFATEDMREGMQAFIEKRKANFQGR